MEELRAAYGEPGADLARLFAVVTGKDKNLLVSEVLQSMAHNAEEAPRRIQR
jgi:hypothetical protein